MAQDCACSVGGEVTWSGIIPPCLFLRRQYVSELMATRNHNHHGTWSFVGFRETSATFQQGVHFCLVYGACNCCAKLRPSASAPSPEHGM